MANYQVVIRRKEDGVGRVFSKLQSKKKAIEQAKILGTDKVAAEVYAMNSDAVKLGRTMIFTTSEEQ